MIHKISKIKQSPDLIPDKAWLRIDKAALLSEISLIQKQQKADQLTFGQHIELLSLRITRKLVPSTLKVVVFAVLVLALSSTGYMAQAAVPGDILYPVKISLEKAELTLASDPVSEAEISMRHADNRLRELEIISSKETDQSSKDQAMAEVVRRLEKNMASADSSLKVAQASGNNDQVSKTLNLARNLSRRADTATKALERQAKDIAGVVIVDGRVIASNQKIYQQVTVNKWSGLDTQQESVRGRDVVTALSEAIKLHEGVSDNALSTVLEIQNQDKNAIQPQEVTDLVTDRIGSQQAKLDEIKRVLASIDDQSVRKLILDDTTKAVAFSQFTHLDSQVKETETTLAAAAKLLSESNEEAASKKLEVSKQLLDMITDVLAKVNVIGNQQDQKASSTPETNTSGSVKIETGSTGTASSTTQKK